LIGTGWQLQDEGAVNGQVVDQELCSHRFFSNPPFHVEGEPLSSTLILPVPSEVNSSEYQSVLGIRHKRGLGHQRGHYGGAAEREVDAEKDDAPQDATAPQAKADVSALRFEFGRRGSHGEISCEHTSTGTT
jgi:hypothetical protein